jgi:HTH-type transcriptional regulator, competence development regulator
MSENLGERIRRKRMEHRLGLRDTARRAGISATFLSRVEIGAEKAMPSEAVLQRLAELLDDDLGELMALAGRIPRDVTDYMKTDPKMPEFLRRARAKKISAEELMALLDKEKDGG